MSSFYPDWNRQQKITRNFDVSKWIQCECDRIESYLRDKKEEADETVALLIKRGVIHRGN